MKNLLSVLPILSAVYFVEAHPKETDIGVQNVDTDALVANGRSFAPKLRS
jgi:hypothetical protein